MSDTHFIFFEPADAAPIHAAWDQYIVELLPESQRDRITVLKKTFEDLPPLDSDFDCIVSPANSYGLMDGG